MMRLLCTQFSQNSDLKAKLLETRSTTLVEAAPRTQCGVLVCQPRTGRHRRGNTEEARADLCNIHDMLCGDIYAL